MKTIASTAAFLALTSAAATSAFAQIPSVPSLGMAEGRCRPGEPGPAFYIYVVGLKDRAGTLKAELYPATDEDFLADDNKLVAAGKTFRRVVIDVPSSGPTQLCIRAPSAGPWTIALLHDRNGDRKFNLFADGVGFPGNPGRLTRSKPPVATGRAIAGRTPVSITVRMLYLNGFGFSPLSQR